VGSTGEARGDGDGRGGLRDQNVPSSEQQRREPEIALTIGLGVAVRWSFASRYCSYPSAGFRPPKCQLTLRLVPDTAPNASDDACCTAIFQLAPTPYGLPFPSALPGIVHPAAAASATPAASTPTALSSVTSSALESTPLGFGATAAPAPTPPAVAAASQPLPAQSPPLGGAAVRHPRTSLATTLALAREALAAAGALDAVRPFALRAISGVSAEANEEAVSMEALRVDLSRAAAGTQQQQIDVAAASPPEPSAAATTTDTGSSEPSSELATPLEPLAFDHYSLLEAQHLQGRLVGLTNAGEVSHGTWAAVPLFPTCH